VGGDDGVGRRQDEDVGAGQPGQVHHVAGAAAAVEGDARRQRDQAAGVVHGQRVGLAVGPVDEGAGGLGQRAAQLQDAVIEQLQVRPVDDQLQVVGDAVQGGVVHQRA